MLSHLRFHRRGPSNPASPLPEQTPTSPPSALLSSYSPDAFSPDLRPVSSNSSAQPPTLPPITRVTSAESEPASEPRRDADMAPQPDSRPPRSPYNGGDTGFIGGLALRKYRRDMESHASDAMETAKGGASQSKPAPVNVNPPRPSRPPPKVVRNGKLPASFSTPTDLHNSATAPTGRRPAGARLHTDLPALSVTTSNIETPKPKKGLPFLKNPMSTLLMRRKTSQQVPELVPLPLRNRPEEPMYDPRIRGTRVHDFSAPRPKKVIPNKDPAYILSPSQSNAPSEQEKLQNQLASPAQGAQASTTNQHTPSVASESIYSQDSQTLKATTSSVSDPRTGFADAVLSSQHLPPIPPPKDEDPISVQPRSSQASRLIDDTSSVYSRSSTRQVRSRGASLSSVSGQDVPSALPRHMKSTSSRFSFDMIGAAKQEKLLEDRHRQRELEKQTTEPPASRDSRFDDFDDDSFDYDAMMDDDGLEERIPGVNADYDDDEYPEEEINMVGDDYGHEIGDDTGNAGVNVGDGLDPDDDQENFSGFVFERSNPTSSLTSPHSAGFMATPRDPEGNAIGYATSRDSPRLPNSLSPSFLSPQMMANPADLQTSGLGIQGLDLPGPTELQQNQQVALADPLKSGRGDDLYYDDGMIGTEAEFAEDLAAPPEWDDAPFDESLFDINDTDKFGRPIAGAFEQAQLDRRAAQQDTLKRESDLTSRFSAHSAASQSTAHTSVSVTGQKPNEKPLKESAPVHSVDESSATFKEAESGGATEAAYQAALAAAANEALLSGKFQRTSSPHLDETPSSEMGYSPNTPGRGGLSGEDGCDDFGYSYEDMADFELDDDAIIAEANASALANDSDEWYGQEFGFYSAPISQNYGSHNPTTEFEFANGGFFGPKGGIDRSTSGRMVSREPNLTPITERSEYSNRNSMMSLNMPSFSSGTPIQSPGLAQLALLGDRGDEMSLSALLRLRSKAWGGSQASLVSSQGSPRSERGDGPNSPWAATFSSPTNYHARKNSVLSTVSQDSGDNSASGSPTLTGGIPGFMSSPPPVLPLLGHDSDSPEDMGASPWNAASNPYQLEAVVSPLTDSIDTPLSTSGLSPLERDQSSDSSGSNAPPRRVGMGHRYKGSAESISYRKEEEDGGATRWVLERRRTGELGQEILEREIVEGGRI